MSDKIKLLELAVKKVSEDHDFMAFYLTRYFQAEKISQQDIISTLNCSLEDYYRLGLCRVPKSNSNNFVEQLNKVSAFTHISALELNKIIKRVHSLQTFSNINDNPILMAARDRKRGNKDDEKDKE